MVKCTSCGNKLEEIFLSKKLGTAVKKEGKILWLCSNCQKNNKE